MPKGNTPTSSNPRKSLGDPNCPHCQGLGYVQADHPVGHPEFGKLQICVCREGEVSEHHRSKLFGYSQLDELKELTFENYDSRGRIGLGEHQADSLEYAYNQSKHFAQTLDGWLLLQGKYGAGKTHLAAAIANHAVSRYGATHSECVLYNQFDRSTSVTTTTPTTATQRHGGSL